MELAPEFAQTHYFLALAYLATERYDEAIAGLEDTIKLSDENAVLLGTHAHALARAGREQDARQALQRLEERSAKEYVPALSRALAHIGLGQSDEAFAELDRAFTERSSWLLSLNVEPLFDPDPAGPSIPGARGPCRPTGQGERVNLMAPGTAAFRLPLIFR